MNATQNIKMNVNADRLREIILTIRKAHRLQINYKVCEVTPIHSDGIGWSQSEYKVICCVERMPLNDIGYPEHIQTVCSGPKCKTYAEAVDTVGQVRLFVSKTFPQDILDRK